MTSAGDHRSDRLARRLEAARSRADVMVAERGLVPPVDVYAIAAELAVLRREERDDLRFDAFIYGLGGETPRPVLVYDAGQPTNRIRFTLAHEVGHIELAWHLGTIACHTAEPDPTGSSGLARVVGPVEREADAFAARLLVPSRFVAGLDATAPGKMLEELAAAEVSPQAGLLALANLLPEGYIFVLLEAGTRVTNVYLSPGTRPLAGLRRGDTVDRKGFSASLDATGIAGLAGRRVLWGRYERSLNVGEGSSDWQSLLETILADIEPGQTRGGPRWMSLNGIVSAANSSRRDTPVEELAAAIRQAVRSHPELDALYGHPLFGEFVQCRARAFRLPPKASRTRGRLTGS